MGKRVRKITVRAERRSEPDLRKLSRAIIALVAAQAEAEAQADHERAGTRRRANPSPMDPPPIKGNDAPRQAAP